MPPSPPLRQYDAIVIGLGCAGSATLYHLAKKGLQVLGVEAQPTVAHDQGSSHGESRIIRLAYQEHPSYVPLLQRSYQLWNEMQEQYPSSPPLLHTTGCLSISSFSTSTSNTLSSSFLREKHTATAARGALEAAYRYNLPIEALTPDQLQQRFPLFQLPNSANGRPREFEVVYDPSGGIIHPEKAIQRHIEAAQDLGATVVCNASLVDWGVEQCDSRGGHRVRVHVRSGADDDTARSNTAYLAEKIVLTMGPWLKKYLPNILRVERQVVGWFGQNTNSPAPNPVFLIDDDEGNYYYGFPPTSKHEIKIGKYYHLHETIQGDPSTISRTINPADEVVLRECLRDYIPTFAPLPMQRASVCMFTHIPDGHFLLSALPGAKDRVIIGSACSGHGFKFMPVLGEILADLTCGGTAHDIRMHRWSMDRFVVDKLA